MNVWSRCIQHLKSEFEEDEISMWISPLQGRINGQDLILYAPNPFILDHVKEHYLRRIIALFHQLTNSSGQVSMEVGSAPKPSSEPQATISSQVTKPKLSFVSNLNLHYTFDNFIEGHSNQLGLAATYQVAHHPGIHTNNPLLLYGGTGLGKTHLMHAAGNAMNQTQTTSRVLYLRSYNFLVWMTQALQEKNMNRFRLLFQKLDLLLIDDIHFFIGKNHTQEEFFNIFSALFDRNRKIILSSNRHPSELEGIEASLKSRLISGLSVEIKPPNLETRISILLAEAQQRQIDLHEDIIYLIAEYVHSNIRDLIGALNTLIAHAQFMACPISFDFTRKTLCDKFYNHRQIINISKIQKVVADYYGLEVKSLLSKSRARPLVRPRQIAMALSKKFTDSSFRSIGNAFTCRDSATVIHACRTIQNLVTTDSKTNEDWEKLIRILNK